MPKIDFNEFQKKPDENEEYTVRSIQVKDCQYFIEELDVVFDVIDLDFDGKGPGMEILMSFAGEDFKMRCDIVPKDIFDTYDVNKYLIELAEEYLPCLKCKKKFLDGLCDSEKEEGDEEA